jgi:hypothetical protein
MLTLVSRAITGILAAPNTCTWASGLYQLDVMVVSNADTAFGIAATIPATYREKAILAQVDGIYHSEGANTG